MSDATLPLYLDHNATTPLASEVFEAMLPYLRGGFGNPSSQHRYGQDAALAIATAREQVASLVGASADEIIFTSGGTEANNLAIFGALEALPERAPRHIWTSLIEHPATAQPILALERRGYSVSRLSVGGDSRCCLPLPGQLEAPALVSVMHSNNETGTLQPVEALAKLARAANPDAIIHTDAAQSVGKVALDVRTLGVDLLSVAGHKLYAPKGVGALYVRRGVTIKPLLLGAGHEGGLRPGTENVASIVGLGQACALAQAHLQASAQRLFALTEALFGALKHAIPDLTRNGHPTMRLPNTLNVSFPHVRGAALLALAPDIAASTGSACHDGQHSTSATLNAMGLEPAAALGAVRLSLGRQTSAADVRRAAQSLIQAHQAALTA